MNDVLNFAGEVKIEAVEYMKFNRTAIDILAQVDSVTIYEDMFSPFITGELNMRDTIDLPNMLGRSGKDMIYLSVITPTLKTKINGMFYVYKISEMKIEKDRMRTYKIHFASGEMIFDITKHISRKYNGDCDKIVTDIIKEAFKTTKPVLVDKSSNSLSFISNFWNGSKCIAYIQERALSESKTPGFLFFENREGFIFRDITSIFKENIIQEFDGSDYVIDGRTKLTRNPEKQYKVITGIRVDTSFDFVKNYMEGAIKTRMYSFDIISRKMSENTFDITRTSFISPNDKKIWPTDVIDTIEPSIMSFVRGRGTHGSKDSGYNPYLQDRISLISSITNNKIEIDVLGRVDYTCGKMVSLNMNQLRAIGKNEKENEYIDRTVSGKYLVSAVAHYITREGHKCTLELCKESTLLQ